MTSETRIERDALGEFPVPASAYYGIETARAAANFPISGERMPRAFIRALGLLKAGAARANRDLGLVDADLAGAIQQAASEVANGDFDAEFIVDVFQSGSGTSTNMNANEVVANRANELLGRGPRGVYVPVDPHDHAADGEFVDVGQAGRAMLGDADDHRGLVAGAAIRQPLPAGSGHR